jgi:hypothetical protein
MQRWWSVMAHLSIAAFSTFSILVKADGSALLLALPPLGAIREQVLQSFIP